MKIYINNNEIEHIYASSLKLESDAAIDIANFADKLIEQIVKISFKDSDTNNIVIGIFKIHGYTINKDGCFIYADEINIIK